MNIYSFPKIENTANYKVNNNYKKYVPLLVFTLLILIIFIKIYREHNTLQTEYKFTIAVIKNISAAVDGGPDADFEYIVNGKRYNGFAEINYFKTKVSAGDSFLLKFNPQHPDIHEILVNKQIECKVENIPDSGWNDMKSFKCQ